MKNIADKDLNEFLFTNPLVGDISVKLEIPLELAQKILDAHLGLWQTIIKVRGVSLAIGAATLARSA